MSCNLALNFFYMLAKKVPFYLVVISFLLPTCFFAFYYYYTQKEQKAAENVVYVDNSCGLSVRRLGGYKYIRPLLFAEPSCESPNLSECKSEIERVINNNRNAGNISDASVYLREFTSAQWISINEEEKYSPGSLMKIPELIAFYKMNELNPGILNKTIKYDHVLQSDKTPTFLSKHIELGKSYTIRELLEYMIVYSDNNATMLLNQNIDRAIFSRVFSEIGLKEPDYTSNQYPISANEFSIFMKELFNASYLNRQDSESCLELLNRSDFKDGLISGLPSNCSVSHKFGEGGYNTAPHFSESAIVYCGKRPYLLTVMTKGSDMKKLPKVIQEISKTVFDVMNNRA